MGGYWNHLSKRPWGIEFRDVHFSYGNKEILHGINVKLTDKTTTAVIGSSSSGKTTLCNLIARFWDVDSGSVKIEELIGQEGIYADFVLGRKEAIGWKLNA